MAELRLDRDHGRVRVAVAPALADAGRLAVARCSWLLTVVRRAADRAAAVPRRTGRTRWARVLLAGFFNLLVVAVAAPLAGLAVPRPPAQLPSVVARDYAGTALLVAVTCVLVVGGLLHRSAVSEERSDRAAVRCSACTPTWSPRRRASAAGLRPAGRCSASRRTTTACACTVSRAAPPLCLFVNTDQRPAGIRRDPSREPNTGLQP